MFLGEVSIRHVYMCSDGVDCKSIGTATSSPPPPPALSNSRFRQPGRAAADMDDTLVLTADADAASHAAVLDVLHEAAPKVDADAVLERWKRLFRRAPWDSSHEARR